MIRLHKVIAVVSFAMISMVASPSWADGSVYAGLGGANLTDLGSSGLFGLGGQFGARYDLTEYWAAFADIGGSYHFEKVESEELTLPAQIVSHVSAGVRYNLDVFTYVPWASLALAGYLDTPTTSEGSTNVNAGLKVGLGVDWRLDRFWSVGLYADIHALLTNLDVFPVYSQFGLNLTHHFRF